MRGWSSRQNGHWKSTNSTTLTLPGCHRLAISGGTGGDGWSTAHAIGRRIATRVAAGHSHRMFDGGTTSFEPGKKMAAIAAMMADASTATQSLQKTPM